MSRIENISLFIPRVYVNYTEEMVKDAFKDKPPYGIVGVFKGHELATTDTNEAYEQLQNEIDSYLEQHDRDRDGRPRSRDRARRPVRLRATGRPALHP